MNYERYSFLIEDCLIFLQQPVRRLSLTPPPESQVSWLDYISAPSGEHPALGRELVHKETSKAFKATVAMVSYISYFKISLIEIIIVIATLFVETLTLGATKCPIDSIYKSNFCVQIFQSWLTTKINQ